MVKVKVLRPFCPAGENRVLQVGDVFACDHAWAQSLFRAGLAEPAPLETADVEPDSAIEVAMLDTGGKKRGPRRRNRRKSGGSSS